mmetsp:Transcript_14056/g.32212  ORF Transcript_14056/g.32212 Transcript_14056/m.32212 type:complete len:212 (-) Transcript_14056:621-1256(-)
MASAESTDSSCLEPRLHTWTCENHRGIRPWRPKCPSKKPFLTLHEEGLALPRRDFSAPRPGDGGRERRLGRAPAPARTSHLAWRTLRLGVPAGRRGRSARRGGGRMSARPEWPGCDGLASLCRRAAGQPRTSHGNAREGSAAVRRAARRRGGGCGPRGSLRQPDEPGRARARHGHVLRHRTRAPAVSRIVGMLFRRRPGRARERGGGQQRN